MHPSMQWMRTVEDYEVDRMQESCACRELKQAMRRGDNGAKQGRLGQTGVDGV